MIVAYNGYIDMGIQWSRIKSSEINLHKLQSNDFQHWQQEYPMGKKMVSSVNGVGKTGEVQHAEP